MVPVFEAKMLEISRAGLHLAGTGLPSAPCVVLADWRGTAVTGLPAADSNFAGADHCPLRG
jgi:hypothetical protein